MNQPFTIRRSSSRKDDAFNSKRGGHNSFESKGKTLDTRALFDSLWEYQSFKEEADIIFPEVLLADDGRSFDFKQSQSSKKD
jgi:hypothetical protein